MSFYRPISKAGVIFVIGCVAVSIAGCGGQGLKNLSPFKKEETRLEGERRPVFPENHKFGREPEFKRVGQDDPGPACRDDDAECKAKSGNRAGQ